MAPCIRTRPRFPQLVYLHKPIPLGFPHSSAGKSSACSTGNLGSIPGLGRSPGEGNGKPLQCSCLENPMDRGAWQAIVRGVARVGHNLDTKPPSPLLRKRRTQSKEYKWVNCSSGAISYARIYHLPISRKGKIITMKSVFHVRCAMSLLKR